MSDLTQVSKTEAAPGFGATLLIMGAIGLGAAIGMASPSLGASLSAGIDPTLLILVGLLFFEVRLRAVVAGLANLRFMSLALVANFVIVPLFGVAIATVFVSGHPLIYTGLIIYFLAPCTDWFLSFTRMARGDTALGASLLPINMIIQLLLLPLWLWLFARHVGVVDFGAIGETMWVWFIVPFVIAQVVRWILSFGLPEVIFDKICMGVSQVIPLVTAVLILQIFATHSPTIAAHLDVLVLVVLAILTFFVATYVMAEWLSRIFGLPYPEQVLLAMTTAARNAPLMLAVTAIAIPDQPLVYAALVIGMLVEFPHLTALKQLLLLKAGRGRSSNDLSVDSPRN